MSFMSIYNTENPRYHSLVQYLWLPPTPKRKPSVIVFSKWAAKAPQIRESFTRTAPEHISSFTLAKLIIGKRDSETCCDNNGVSMMEHKGEKSRGINDAVPCEMTGYKFVTYFWANVPVVTSKEQLWQATEEHTEEHRGQATEVLTSQEDFVFVRSHRGLWYSESVLVNWCKMCHEIDLLFFLEDMSLAKQQKSMQKKNNNLHVILYN